MPLPSVSVIIPVYQDSEGLRACLDSLSRQSYPLERFEILVVDNNKIAQPLPNDLPFTSIRVFHEPEPGSYRARNRAVREARGKVLAFTDSDCLAEPDWITEGVTALQSASRVFVAGAVDQFAGLTPTLFELYSLIFLTLDQRDFTERLSFGGAGNLFVLRRDFLEIGPFQAELKSAGDVEWCHRALKKGFRALYHEAALVRHPARTTWQAILKKERRLVGGALSLERQGLRVFPKSQWMLLGSLASPFRIDHFRRICRGAKKPKERIALYFLNIFCRYIRVIEWCRLALGGAAQR